MLIGSRSEKATLGLCWLWLWFWSCRPVSHGARTWAWSLYSGRALLCPLRCRPVSWWRCPAPRETCWCWKLPSIFTPRSLLTSLFLTLRGLLCGSRKTSFARHQPASWTLTQWWWSKRNGSENSLCWFVLNRCAGSLRPLRSAGSYPSHRWSVLRLGRPRTHPFSCTRERGDSQNSDREGPWLTRCKSRGNSIWLGILPQNHLPPPLPTIFEPSQKCARMNAAWAHVGHVCHSIVIWWSLGQYLCRGW